MASLQLRGRSYACVFCWHGQRKWFTIGKVSETEARAKSSQVDYLLMRLKQRLVELPPAVDIVEFVRHDGKPPLSLHAIPERQALTLTALRDRYLETHRRSLEPRTIEGIELHFKHLCTALGEAFPIRELKLTDLQGYVDRRAKAKGKGGKRLSPATIRKEIVTLRTAWNWGVRIELVAGRFPYVGLRYPKGDEKPPFQTREEIRRQVAAGGLKSEQIKELWHALYLQAHEVAGLLAHAREHAAHPWVYPFIAAAAHTGARRSELIRMGVGDVDLAGGTITIRERKRVKGKRSTRRAPLTPQLRAALEEWLAVHPGGPALFCHALEVERSKKRSRTTGHRSSDRRPTTLGGRLETVRPRPETPAPGPLTPKECHDHFKRTLRDSEWGVVRGLHILRHSFISCLASAGVDQRIIDDIVGHCSEEMRRRYRHLTPALKGQAVISVFNDGGPSPVPGGGPVSRCGEVSSEATPG
jgi:integrase